MGIDQGCEQNERIWEDRTEQEIERPYVLVSLWEMLSNFAYAWVHLLRRLRDCEDELKTHMTSHSPITGRGLLGDPSSVLLPPQIQSEIRAILRNEMLPQAQRLGLVVSIDSMHRLFKRIDPEHQGDELPRAQDIQQRLQELREQIEVELRNRSFLFVPSQQMFLYDREQLFGQAVFQNFGKASFHIREAGSCLALSRPTAAVFHLMCILEVALDSLAHHVGLPYSEKNWGTILDDIEKQIQRISIGKVAVPPDWDKTWASQVAVGLFHFKEAWRNHTAHARAKYSESEAGRIFDHVKVLMQQLATRLEERP